MAGHSTRLAWETEWPNLGLVSLWQAPALPWGILGWALIQAVTEHMYTHGASPGLYKHVRKHRPRRLHWGPRAEGETATKFKPQTGRYWIWTHCRGGEWNKAGAHFATIWGIKFNFWIFYFFLAEENYNMSKSMEKINQITIPPTTQRKVLHLGLFSFQSFSYMYIQMFMQKYHQTVYLKLRLEFSTWHYMVAD